MAACYPDDIFSDIHYNFSYLSRIAELINNKIQECDQNGVGILIKLLETEKNDHENLKVRLRIFVEEFCFPKDVAENLEVFQLEQEVYSVMRTQPKVHVEILNTVLQELIKEEEEIFMYMNDLVAHFNEARISKNAANVAEESNKGEEPMKDIAASLRGFNHSKAENKTINRIVKTFAQAKNFELEREGSNIDGDNQNAEKNLGDVIVGMYGFRPSMVNRITRFVENRKMMNVASENQQKGVKLDGKMKELESFAVFAILKPEGSGELDWEIVETLREKFEALKKKVLHEVEGIHDKGSEGMPKCCDHFHEKLEILKVVKGWVFHLECNCCQLIQNLNALMLGCEAAAAKFQEFKSAMGNLRSYHHGLVPIAVYKVLAMQELGGVNLNAGLWPTGKPESSSARTDKRLLYEEIEYDRVIDLLQEIILLLRFALITSGLPNEETVHNMEIEVLFSYENALVQSEEALKDIERKMKRRVSILEELLAGKGKRIGNQHILACFL